MTKEYKVLTLREDFKPTTLNVPQDYNESDKSYYIKQGLLLFGIFTCIFLLILDFEWMAGRL